MLHRSLPMLVAALVLWLSGVWGVCRAEEVLHFEQKSLDLGPIGDDQSVIHAFPFTNSTQRTIRLAMSYCHFCAPPILDKQVLQPGEAATLVLELDPTGKRGPVSASVSIAEEGRPGTASEIILKGEVCPRVWIEPLSMFPRIVRGREVSSSFTVLGRSSKFKVQDVHSDLPGVSIDIAEPVEVQDCGAASRQQTVTVKFPTTMPIGRFNASLKIQTSDEQARPKFVTIDGEVIGRLTIQPEHLGARLAPGEIFSKTFDVIADQGPLMLSSLDVQAADEAQNLGIDAMPTSDPARVRVTVSGRAPLRERQAVDIRIRIAGSTLSEPGEDSLVVPITLVVFAKQPK